MNRSNTYRQAFGDADAARNDQRAEAPKPAAARASEPYDAGELLWQAPRGTTGAERLRLARRTFSGHEFLDFRVEYRDRATGEWRPTGKGISIRLREIADVQAVLGAEVARLIADDRGRR